VTRLAALTALLFLIGCAPADVDVPAPEAGMPPPDGAEAAPESSVGKDGDGGGAQDNFGKEEYIGIMADFVCVERNHPEGPERAAAHEAVVANYGFAQELLDRTAADIKKEKEVHEQLQGKIKAAADALCPKPE
jgi:hypothetical protein